MGGGPAELKKLMNRWAEEQHARQAQKAAAARKAEDMADFRRQLLLKGAIDVTQSAYELDRHYGRDWDRASLQRMANDPSLSMQKRAKLVEIMILRGANNDMPYAQMRDMPRDFDFMGINGADLNEKASYQLAAQNAVMAGGDPMIWHLSNSADQLPSGRLPATELMNGMLQKGGTFGDYERRQDVEKWIKGLDADTRGRLMYHIADAAQSSDIGGGRKVTGFELGGGPLSFGIQWENAKDTHWKETGRDIEASLAHQLAGAPDQKESFYEGYKMAEKRLDTTKAGD